MGIGYYEFDLFLALCLLLLVQNTIQDMMGIEFVIDQNNLTLIYTEQGRWPEVQCKAECDPVCDVVWMKDGNEVNHTGLLSFKSVSEDVIGEYVCSASNKETNETQTRSIFVNRISETEENRNINESTPRTIVVLEIFVALLSLLSISLIAHLVWWRLFRHRFPCTSQRTSDNETNKETTPEKRISEPAIYENLKII